MRSRRALLSSFRDGAPEPKSRGGGVVLDPGSRLGMTNLKDAHDHTDKILSRKEGGVGYLIFNNPERHNAVSLEMWEAPRAILDEFAKDNAVRVVVLTGAGGKAFVSGADISKFEKRALDAGRRSTATTSRSIKANTAFYEFPKPTIAMIRGYCIGGGVGLALCCDMRICSENSKFGVPAAKLGLGYGYRRHQEAGRRRRAVLRQGNLLHRAAFHRRRGAADGPRQSRRAGRGTRSLRQELCRHDRRAMRRSRSIR